MMANSFAGGLGCVLSLFATLEFDTRWLTLRITDSGQERQSL